MTHLAARLLISWLAISAYAHADDITFSGVESRVELGFYYVDANATITLAPDVREAVVSGVPLDFSFDFLLCVPRKWLWDSCFLSLRRTFRLARHALAEGYVVTDLVTERTVTQSTLEDALRELGSLRQVSLTQVADLPLKQPIQGRVQARLEIEALPAPLRPVAYLSPSWHLRSAWMTWEVTP